MRALDFALNRILPEDLRSDSYDMSKKGVAELMASLARAHPEQYRDVAKRMGDLGRKNAFLQGFTIGPDDTKPVIDTSTYYTRMDVELAALRARNLPADDFDSARNEIMQRYSDLIEKDTMSAALKSENSFARSVASGARGNPAHVKAILSTPGIYADAQGNIIPLFVRNSFASGVRPAETLAGTYGGRAAVISTKVATAKGGDYSKILNQSTSHYNVTEKDCGVSNGLDFEPSDASLRGRVLARDVAGLKAGSVIDKHALALIRKQDQLVIARSPMTCKSAHGLCAHCAGLQADGSFPRVGDSLGITAGQSVGEPIVQSGLNAKHNAGAAKGKKEFSGFDVVSQFAQIPDEFKDKATVSERDGVITAVRAAPQGGHYVSVDNVSHFVLPGFELMVKPGDAVEAGDQLADGLINPSDIVRLRGLGEGRRYYADRLEKILKDSGQPPDRRNIELIARATVDHLRVDDADEESDFLPDDLVREADYMQSYKRPDDTADTPLHKSTGLYLQQPVLHFTVGTRITPKIAERMRKVGATNVLASPTAPPFTPDMQRLRTASHSDKDWMSSLSTSYLGKQMTQSAERGDETDIESNYHYAPRLAAGVGFGANIERTGKF
jgi:DNA-directed RNA polymerase subunit beta'